MMAVRPRPSSSSTAPSSETTRQIICIVNVIQGNIRVIIGLLVRVGMECYQGSLVLVTSLTDFWLNQVILFGYIMFGNT